jgi:hypothetical protein
LVVGSKKRDHWSVFDAAAKRRRPAGVIAAQRVQSSIQHGPPSKRKMPTQRVAFLLMGLVRLGRTTVRQNAPAFYNEARSFLRRVMKYC